MDTIATLRQYNLWRRGQEDWPDDERGPNPKAIGEAIDLACDELDRLRGIERAAQEMFRVKGRYNTQVACCHLGEKLGLPVKWPEKMRQCVDVATLTPDNEAVGPERSEGPTRAQGSAATG